MRLADFIQQNIEPILHTWEKFAADQLPAAKHMNSLALRDHAEQILDAIVKDLSTLQSREAQLEKSLGRAPVLSGETAAQTHALLRAKGGFQITQLVAEYRALRASVLRQWIDACKPGDVNLEDIGRFNEAVDQAIAESVGFFSKEVDQARNLFLGMLGHDLRTPLQAILMTATYLNSVNMGETVSAAALRLIKSGARMQALLDDLLDYNRSTLGMGIDVSKTEVDLAILFKDEVAQIQSVHPNRLLTLEVKGDTRGSLDGPRLLQVLSNLVVNAINYGAQDEPVRVSLIGEPSEIRFEIRNAGPTMAPETLLHIFEPLKRGLHQNGAEKSKNSLGLGLYIAREVVKSHGGEIEAQSENGVTTFIVRLPR